MVQYKEFGKGRISVPFGSLDLVMPRLPWETADVASWRAAPEDEQEEHHRAYEPLPDKHGVTLPNFTVTQRSPMPLRRAAEVMAYYFKREFSYDAPQYDADARWEPNGPRVYLWGEDVSAHLIYGAACFHWMEWDNHSPTWSFSWVWVHPFRRRQGVLSKVWPYFRARYGVFWVERPLSPSMEAFLSKHEPDWLTPDYLREEAA
jgi:hypothetical protein